ncbi:MAG: hypothetical protein ACE5H9_18455 [Anaerolineae bacterium]
MPDYDQDAAASTENHQDSIKPLSLVVEQEARRVLSEAQLEPDPALVAEGWERRFIGDARQVKEAMELYAELGYEVRAEPVQAEEMGEDCDDCQLLILLQFKTIYTRKKRR